MIGRGTENTAEGSENVKQAGRDLTIHGMSADEFREILNERLAAQRADLEATFEQAKRADAAEAKVLRMEADQLRSQMAELQRQIASPGEALKAAQARVAELERLLDTSTAEIGANRIADAKAALEAGDAQKADEIFAEVEAHEAAAVERAAEAAYGRGLIAEGDVSWHDAATHFGAAARFAPTYDRLLKAREFTWRAGAYDAALRLGSDLLQVARLDGDQEKLAEALNEHALTLSKRLAGTRRPSRSTVRRWR